MIETIGWTGAILFAVCGIPQAIQCYREKHANGLNWIFLITWSGGEVLTIAYIMMTSMDLILLVNYFVNSAVLVILIYYKWKGERK